MPLISLPLLCQHLGPLAGRFDVDAVDSCDSTNAVLLTRAGNGAPSGTVLVADEQTAGRGRRGRPWLSSPENSLTFSLLWRWQGPMEHLSGLSLAVGLALVQALEHQGARQVGLKWPNDLLTPAGKLGGILVELAGDRRGMQVVIGIGLNLRAPTLADQPVSGLADCCPVLPERHSLLAGLLASLLQILETQQSQGFAPLREAWQQRHLWQGRRVRLLEAGQVLQEGVCLGVDNEGALLLETTAGVERCLAGDLSLREAL